MMIDEKQQDPAVLFYPGDYAKDVQHMNRLQRGGYIDILMHQVRFGHLTNGFIQRVLGNDYDKIWEIICITLEKDEDGKWYSLWLENAIKKRQKYCESRGENRSKGYKKQRDKKEKCKHSYVNHMCTICGSHEQHMEDENENENSNWRSEFKIYQESEEHGYICCSTNTQWIEERQRYHPNLDIKLSLEKAHFDFWHKEAGWKHKKKSRSKDLDWSATFANALTMKSNQVFKKLHSFGPQPPDRQELINNAQEFLKRQEKKDVVE